MKIIYTIYFLHSIEMLDTISFDVEKNIVYNLNPGIARLFLFCSFTSFLGWEMWALLCVLFFPWWLTLSTCWQI